MYFLLKKEIQQRLSNKFTVGTKNKKQPLHYLSIALLYLSLTIVGCHSFASVDRGMLLIEKMWPLL